jgi:hypothetical protein
MRGWLNSTTQEKNFPLFNELDLPAEFNSYDNF